MCMSCGSTCVEIHMPKYTHGNTRVEVHAWKYMCGSTRVEQYTCALTCKIFYSLSLKHYISWLVNLTPVFSCKQHQLSSTMSHFDSWVYSTDIKFKWIFLVGLIVVQDMYEYFKWWRLNIWMFYTLISCTITPLRRQPIIFHLLIDYFYPL